MPYSAILAIVALPLTLAQTSVVIEDTPILPPRWRFEAAANGDEHLSLSIALTQPGLDDLETLMLSQPEQTRLTASTGFLSLSQLLMHQAPQDGATDAVMDWLADSQIIDALVDGPWIRFNTTVTRAKRLFEADLAYYSHGDAAPVLRAPTYSVPSSLAGYIDFVFPLAHFMPLPATTSPQPIPLASRYQIQKRQLQHYHNGLTNEAVLKKSNACVSGFVTPKCVRQLYNWPLNISSQRRPSQVRLGIAGFLDQYISYNDVHAFLDVFAPAIARSAPAYNFSVELVNGGSNVQVPRSRIGLEASLDVQYAMALAFPAQITYYSTGGRGDKLDGTGQLVSPRSSNNEPYLALLSHLAGLPDNTIPHVLSISYSDDEQSVPRPYAERVCRLLLQLAARGTTVLVATGDGGSGGIGQGVCVRNDGSGKRALLPTFPSSCPWVTGVGATSNAPPSLAADFSSGGFSNYFKRPRWQDQEVTKYISKVLQGSNGNDNKEGLYNASGRAIPDIAAVGSEFPIVWGGILAFASGTSASTPVVASMIALVNDARLRKGRPPLGWLNRKLYSSGLQDVFQDVVDGISMECPFGQNESVPGWPAAPGWDAVTGLGVPHDFSLLMDALLNA